MFLSIPAPRIAIIKQFIFCFQSIGLICSLFLLCLDRAARSGKMIINKYYLQIGSNKLPSIKKGTIIRYDHI